MMPFNGLMQALTGSTATLGGNTAGNASRNHGLPGGDDAAGSFLERVQQLMERAVSGGNDGDGVFDLGRCDADADMATLDALPKLITDELDQADILADLPAGQAIVQAPDAPGLGDWPNIVPPGIIHALFARNDAGQPTEGHVGQALSAIQGELVAQANGSAGGQSQPAAHDQPPPSNAAGIAIPTGPINDTMINENSVISNSKDGAVQEGLESEINHASFSASAPAGDAGKTNVSQFIQERLASGSGSEPKGIEPVTRQPHPVADPPRDTESIVTALTDQKTASSEDETADFQGRRRSGRIQQVEVADETDFQERKASDSVKVAAIDNAKSQAPFQDTVKTMAADPSANPADKPTVGQATPLSRTEASAARTFQTTVMDQIVDKAAMRSIHGRSEIQIRLKPEFLGNVQMNIATDKTQVVVRILTDQPAVKEIIETHLHHLKAELQNQGLTIDKFEVIVNPDTDQQHSRDQFAQMFKNNSFQNGRRQAREPNPETLSRGGDPVPDDDPPNREGINYFA
jgi:flagellar hook-length control protein FliK